MMNEIKEIENLLQIQLETILVADSLNRTSCRQIVAQEFKKTVDLTGIILTRVDGDGKGWSSS